MLTRDEAGQTWCPMVRIARLEDVMPGDASEGMAVVAGCNTDALGGMRVPASCRCIADKCAMWRWEPVYGPALEPLHPICPPRSGPRLEPTHGYCGLAGKPV